MLQWRSHWLVPDRSLAMPPFDTLVVEASAEPQHLLDVGPPIEFARNSAGQTPLNSLVR